MQEPLVQEIEGYELMLTYPHPRQLLELLKYIRQEIPTERISLTTVLTAVTTGNVLPEEWLTLFTTFKKVGLLNADNILQSLSGALTIDSIRHRFINYVAELMLKTQQNPSTLQRKLQSLLDRIISVFGKTPVDEVSSQCHYIETEVLNLKRKREDEPSSPSGNIQALFHPKKQKLTTSTCITIEEFNR